MIRRIALLLALAGTATAAELKLPNPGFEPRVPSLDASWVSFEFGEAGSVSRIKRSKDARTGRGALELAVHGGAGGQGVYVDAPVSGLKEGDKITFGIHAKTKGGIPMRDASIGLHIEFLDSPGPDAAILARTDTLGSSAFAGKGLTDQFRRQSTTHTLRDDEIPGGAEAVKVLRFVIVALQPESRKAYERLGVVILDDASAKLQRHGN